MTVDLMFHVCLIKQTWNIRSTVTTTHTQHRIERESPSTTQLCTGTAEWGGGGGAGGARTPQYF